MINFVPIISIADNLIAKSLKTINFHGSLNNHMEVLDKIVYITEAFINQIELFKKIMKKSIFNQYM